MKLIISGSRNINDSEILRRAIFEWAKTIHGDNIPLPLNMWIDEIIEGGARGVDTLAGEFALEHKIDHTVFYANWKKYGKGAGPKRNIRMAEYGKQFPVCHLVAIPETWTGGTAHMIDCSKKLGLNVFVYDKCIKNETI